MRFHRPFLRSLLRHVSSVQRLLRLFQQPEFVLPPVFDDFHRAALVEGECLGDLVHQFGLRRVEILVGVAHPNKFQLEGHTAQSILEQARKGLTHPVHLLHPGFLSMPKGLYLHLPRRQEGAGGFPGGGGDVVHHSTGPILAPQPCQ